MIHDIINLGLLVALIHQVAMYKIYSTKENFGNPNEPTMTVSTSLAEMIKYLYWKLLNKEVVNDPMYPPERNVELRQMPYPNTMFWQRTRGTPDDYQLVGILYNQDVNKNYQLYGRRTYPGSPQWEYYILGNDIGGLTTKFPIQTKNKDEIMDGSQITVPIDKNVYNVTIYDYNQPRYDPYPYSQTTGEYIG